MNKYLKINFFGIFKKIFETKISYNFWKNIRKFCELFQKIWENNFQKYFGNYRKIFRIILSIILESFEKCEQFF